MNTVTEMAPGTMGAQWLALSPHRFNSGLDQDPKQSMFKLTGNSKSLVASVRFEWCVCLSIQYIYVSYGLTICPGYILCIHAMYTVIISCDRYNEGEIMAEFAAEHPKTLS